MNKLAKLTGIFPAKRKDGTLIQGTSPKGKPWQLFNLTLGDLKISGFEIPKEINVGDDVFVEWEVVEKNGYKNNNLKKIYKVEGTVNIETGEKGGVKSESGTIPLTGHKISSIEALEARVAVLEGIVLKREMLKDQLPGEIDPESLPF